jgi:hypothetical protein
MAWAQPYTEEDEEDPLAANPTGTAPDETDTTVPEEPAPPAPVAEPAPVEEPPAPAPVAPALETPAADHPVGFTIGIGFGYIMPATLDQPDAASVRFRLASGLTFEPRVMLQTTQQKDDDGTNETKDAYNTVALVTTVRYPLITRGSFDFILGGGAGMQFSTSDPDGSDNNTSMSSFFLTWGIAIDYWLSQNWSFSLSAFNPLISYSSTEQEFGPDTQTQSDTAIGAVFDPTIFGMLHLFY